MAEKQHALLSASGAHRWLECTPSARLEAQFPESTSTYAEEGMVARAVAEVTTRFALGEINQTVFDAALAEFEGNEYYNEEMQEHADAYADFVVKTLAEAKKVCADPVVILETDGDPRAMAHYPGSGCRFGRRSSDAAPRGGHFVRAYDYSHAPLTPL